MRDTIGALTENWRNRGHSLGFGIGIALGYATLGQIGFEQRLEYAAIGSVTNLASRLCDEAEANQIVVSRRVYGMVEQWVECHAARRPRAEGFQSSGAGDGDRPLARGGRQRRRRVGRGRAAKDVVSFHLAPLAGRGRAEGAGKGLSTGALAESPLTRPLPASGARERTKHAATERQSGFDFQTATPPSLRAKRSNPLSPRRDNGLLPPSLCELRRTSRRLRSSQ